MGEDDEKLVKQAERIGWHNYFDAGFGPQPVARYIGDRLGPFCRRRPQPPESRTEGER